MAAQNPAQNPFDQQRAIPGIKNIIAVSAGKGGVGKSTVSTNLAMALKSLGHSVGLLDADIYGPSIPRMLGAINQKPAINAEQKLSPVERFGLKLMSLGFLVEEGAAVIWRGPMLFKAIDQFLRDVQWGELDYLIIDLPPGTGDVQLTISQRVPVTGAVIVSTPQNIAFIDVKKAIDMFRRLNVPLLGLIENMSYMLNPATQEKIQLFPKGELEKYISENNIKKIGEIPFHPQVASSCEIGMPLLETNPQSTEAQEFIKIAKYLTEITSIK